MKNGFGLKVGDCILIASVLVLSIVWMAVIILANSGEKTVEITNMDGLFAVCPLETDAEFNVPGPLGTSVVKIKEGEVFFCSSPCPTHICVRSGKISMPGGSLVCVPNRVCVSIKKSGSRTDAITF